MIPRVVQINVSQGGIPKRPIQAGRVLRDRIEGDNWNDLRYHGWPDQAICLFSLELIKELKAEGFALFPGALGENLTTEGIDFHGIHLGDVYRVGKEVEIRVTKIRAPCRTIAVYGENIIKAIYDLEVKKGNVRTPKWGRSGFYAEVLNEGLVYPGDGIVQIADRAHLATHQQQHSITS